MISIECHAELDSYLSRLDEIATCSPVERFHQPVPVFVRQFQQVIQDWARSEGLPVFDAPVKAAMTTPAVSREWAAGDRDGVVAFADPQLQALARWYASLTGRACVRLDPSLEIGAHPWFDAAESVFVLGFVSLLNGAWFEDSISAARIKPLGVLAPATLQELSFALAKSMHAQLSRRGLPMASIDEGHGPAKTKSAPNVLARSSDLTHSELAHLLQQRHSLFSLGGHGNNIDVIVSADTALCGRRERMPWDRDTPHYCEVSERACSRMVRGSPHRVSVDEIDASVLFVRTCVGIAHHGGPYSETTVLRNAVFRGRSAAFISFAKVAYVDPSANLILFGLLREGRSLGRACTIVSSIIEARTRWESSLLLLGDPDMCLGRTGAAPAAGFELGRVDNGWRVSVSGLASAFAQHVVSARECRRLGMVPRQGLILEPLEPCLEAAASVFFHWEGDDLVIIVVDTAHGPDPRDLTFDLLPHASPRRSYVAIEGNIELLGEMAAFRAQRYAAGTEVLLDAMLAAHARALQLIPRLKQLGLSGANPNLSKALTRRLGQELEGIAVDFLAACTRSNMGHLFAAYYERLMVSDEVKHGSACPYCGGSTFVSKVSLPLRPEVARNQHYCSRCTVISDTPAASERFQIGCPPTVEAGSVMQVSLAAPACASLTAHAILVFERYNLSWISAESDPPVQPLPIGKAAPVSFDLRVSDRTLPGTYYVIALVCADLGFHVATRPVQVTAKPPINDPEADSPGTDALPPSAASVSFPTPRTV